jgi:hypothetical protein
MNKELQVFFFLYLRNFTDGEHLSKSFDLMIRIH